MNQGKAREREIMNPNRLRIIAGSAKGKKIESPDVYLRPMMAKVREALFSTLNFMGLFEQNTTRWLDIFSGSGSIGLEALSRGACHATFVDFAEDCASTSLRNADHCGFTGQANAICAKAEDVLNHAEEYGIIEPYRVISLTPPYEEVSYDDLITALCNSKCVGEDTIVIIEYPVEMGTLPYILGKIKLFPY
jgi:16S rRNA (guanine(966)-N(2))-methyltransferase RsmD